MAAVEVIHNVLKTSAVEPDLIDVSAPGANEAELRELEKHVGRSLSPAHRELLRQWNGALLDVIRIAATNEIAQSQALLADSKLEDGVVIGSDDAGFLYVERPDGSVWSLDTDGGGAAKLAIDIDASSYVSSLALALRSSSTSSGNSV